MSPLCLRETFILGLWPNTRGVLQKKVWKKKSDQRVILLSFDLIHTFSSRINQPFYKQKLAKTSHYYILIF